MSQVDAKVTFKQGSTSIFSFPTQGAKQETAMGDFAQMRRFSNRVLLMPMFLNPSNLFRSANFK